MTGRPLALLLTLFSCATHGIAAVKAVPQWIVVTSPTFRAALDPLCDHRRAEGMRVLVVQTTDVLGAEQIRGGDSIRLKKHVHILCRESKGPNYVLLVGAAKADGSDVAGITAVPALRGTVGRMRGEPSDNSFGCLDDELMPTIAVGRFPARNAKEVRQMVQKTLAFEQDCSLGLWRNRLTLLIGNPGGTSAIERRFAEWFVQEVAGTRFDRLHPLWSGRIVIHATGSPFCVPNSRLREVSLRYLQEGQVFSFYVGHSNASGFWSQGANFLDRRDWTQLKIPNGPGVFFTCGCFGCQLAGVGGEGYGLAAIRNPDGPVAVFGAHGESYGAMGQLALDGMLRCLAAAEPPPRVADYWLAAKAGLARGKMDGITFWLYDQADGSRGKVSLGDQRLEHLEMWMLLGDPALRLPVQPSVIRLASADAAAASKAIRITGSVPADFPETTVRLTLERPVGSRPIGLKPLPKHPADLHEVMMSNHERANSVVLTTQEIRPRDGKFECTLQLPAELPWRRITVRAIAFSNTELAIGALSLPVGK